MNESRLNIVKVDNTPNSQKGAIRNGSKQDEYRAKLERLWMLDPEQFNPHRNATERERIQRTLSLIKSYLPIKQKMIADLGSGFGELSRQLRDEGGKVLAMDVASNALKKLKELGAESIEIVQDCLPNTKLKDCSYDLVLSTDVIAYLDPKDFRLFFSELSRLIKPEGYVVCSTPLDIYSEDPIERFSSIAETEFKIVEWVFSHHYLQLKILKFCRAPGRFVKGWQDPSYRAERLKNRSGFSNWWYVVNSSTLPAIFWFPISLAFRPLCYLLEQNRSMLLFLEKVCSFFWDTSGISHAIFIAQRRPLEEPTKSEIEGMKTQERPQKRQIWE